MVNTDHAYHTTARNASTESIQTIAPEVNPQIERQGTFYKEFLENCDLKKSCPQQ